MREALLGLAAAAAALAIPAVPAAAQHSGGHHGPRGVSVPDGPTFDRLVHADRVRHGDRRRGRGHQSFFIGRYGYGYGYVDDRSWQSDSYNDWWHDRPDRAYPRWMQTNAKTCDRMWWGGGVWRC